MEGRESRPELCLGGYLGLAQVLGQRRVSPRLGQGQGKEKGKRETSRVRRSSSGEFWMFWEVWTVRIGGE